MKQEHTNLSQRNYILFIYNIMFKILLFFASLKDFSFNQLLDTLITLKQKAYCRTSHSKIIVCIAVSNLPSTTRAGGGGGGGGGGGTSHSKIIVCIAVSNLPSKTPSPLFLVNPPPPILISANCPIQWYSGFS